MNIDIKKAVNFILNEVDIIQYTTDVMGLEYKKYGRNLRTICPLHHDSDPSFTVTVGKQVWHCFGCKEGGSLITLVEKFFNLNRLQAINKILEDLVVDKNQFQEDIGISVRSDILDDAQQYFKKNAVKSKTFKDYFLKKGYSQAQISDLINSMDIGYSKSKEDLRNHLITNKYNENEIYEYDLHGNRFNNSIVFPVKNKYGYISYFRCRTFSGDIKSISSSIDIPTYDEKAFLGIHALKSSRDVILVEGESDYCALRLNGLNVLGMGGLKLNEDLLDILKSYEISNIYIWTDGDQAGWKFIQRLSKEYGKLFCHRKLNGKIIFVDHTDPDEAILSGFNIKEAMDVAEIIPIFWIEQKYSNIEINNDYKRSYDMIDYAIRMIDDYDSMTIEYFIQYLYNRTGFNIEAIRDRFIDHTSTILHDYKAEQHIISYILDDHDYIVHHNIEEDWFVSNASKMIFRLIKNKKANSVNIASVVPAWVNSYLESLPIVNKSNINDYLGVIKDLYRRRMISDIAKNVLRKNTNFDDSLNFLNESLIKLYKKNSSNIRGVTETAKEIIDDIINKKPIKTMMLGEEEWAITNKVLYGIRPGKLIFIMGNTGHGKTTVALNWMYWLSVRQSYRGLIFSGEMDDREITERLMAIGAGVSATNINTNNVSDDDLDRLFTLMKRIEGDTIRIHDAMEVDHVLNAIKYAKIKYDIDYVVFDYLQLSTPSQSMRGMNRTQQLKEFTRRLKVDICDELKIPIIMMGQLDDHGLDDSVPQGRRSSESKLVTQDADVIIAIKEKNKKEMNLNPSGNILYHIDKVRYNRGKWLLSLEKNGISLFIKELSYANSNTVFEEEDDKDD